MTVYVVNASVAAKWFLNEPLSDDAERVVEGANWLYAPDFLLLELDSIFNKRFRRGDMSRDEANAARALLRGLPIHYYPTGLLRNHAFELACDTRTSPYDCLYLALALRLDGRVVTADQRFYDTVGGGSAESHVTWVEDV